MVTNKQKSEIIMLRSLGYTQKEVAERIGISQGTVNYHLREINDEARKRGDASVFISILVDGFLPDIMERLRQFGKLV